MIYFDSSKPNKYRDLKKLLIPHKLESLTWERFGERDGSYVLAKELSHFEGNRVLSYGVGDDPAGVSFETRLSDEGDYVHAYDGSIDEFPKQIQGNIKFFKEFATAENFKDHIDLLLQEGDGHSQNILKMDIEGNEYDWLTEENLNLLSNNFNQFVIEVHSLIEEVPEGWVVEPQMIEAKNNPKKVKKFFEDLNKHFYLFHLHGNNHSPRYVDFPDSLELTYINKKAARSFGYNLVSFPIVGLDKPNYNEREDYVLDWHL